MVATTSLLCPENECQWRVNDLWPCILENARDVRRHYSIIKLSAAFLGKNVFTDFVTMPWEWGSMEHQQFEALHLGRSRGYGTTLIHNRTIGCLSRQKCFLQDRYHVPEWASTEPQRSLNNFPSCILDNLTEMERRYPTMNLSPAFVGENGSDDIASAYYNWVPTEHQQFLWRLRMLHSNELHCAVPKSSFTRSVFPI